MHWYSLHHSVYLYCTPVWHTGIRHICLKLSPFDHQEQNYYPAPVYYNLYTIIIIMPVAWQVKFSIFKKICKFLIKLFRSLNFMEKSLVLYLCRYLLVFIWNSAKGLLTTSSLERYHLTFKIVIWHLKLTFKIVIGHLL